MTVEVADKEAVDAFLAEIGRLLLLADYLERQLDQEEERAREKHKPISGGHGIENLRLARDTVLLDDHRYRVRSMLVVAAVAASQSATTWMLEAARRTFRAKLTIKDLKGSEFDRMMHFAKKVLDVSPSVFDSPAWEAIRSWMRVRNGIVHNDGWMDEPQDIKAAAKVGVPAFSDDFSKPGGKLYLKPEHLQQFCGHVRAFVTDLYFGLKAKGFKPGDCTNMYDEDDSTT